MTSAPSGPAKTFSVRDVFSRVADLPGALATWRGKRRSSPAWTFIAGAIVAVMALPLVTILLLALAPADNIWPHLMAHVLPQAILDTAILMLGVGFLTLVTGTATAWLVTMYRFPGRGLIDRVLVLPLAMPTYIVAYCYVRIARLRRAAANHDARRARLENRQRLLVSRP